jgi:rhamnose utilization protein RhaD (predicted bifunctional aldolase and dehydrogenase)
VRRTFRTAALALAVLAMPAMLAAQGIPQQAHAPDDEAARIQLQLMQVQQRALQDPELQTAQEEIGQALIDAMIRVDPAAEQLVQRAANLQHDVIAAQEAEDEARLRQLGAEAERLQAAFATLRQLAMEDEQLQAAMAAFQNQVIAKMTELEPATPDLIIRLEALQADS